MAKTKQYRYKYSGRRTKLTEECVNKLEEAFSVGANVSQACYYANISRETYYKWIKATPALSDRFEDLKQKLPLQALHNIASRIHGKPTTGDINLSKWLIERRMSDEYGDSLTLKDDRLGLGTPEEDIEVINEFHKRIKDNRLRRSREKAIADGELKE